MTCPTCADVSVLAGSGFLFVDAAKVAPKLRWARPMLLRHVRRCDHPDRAELLVWLSARKRLPRGWRDLPGRVMGVRVVRRGQPGRRRRVRCVRP